MTYWNVSENVRDALRELAAAGEEMHGNLEADDDPGAVAEALADILKRLEKLAAQVTVNIGPLRKVAKAMDDLPGIR
jgi:hypothetical protein